MKPSKTIGWLLAATAVVALGATAIVQAAADRAPGTARGSVAPTDPPADVVSAAEPFQHPLGRMIGLQGAMAVIDGTVTHVNRSDVDEYGAPVDSTQNYIEIDSIRFVEDLEPPADRTEAIENLRDLDGRPLRLHYSGATFEVGREYALFVGHWAPGEYSAMYAIDVAADRPAEEMGGTDVDARLATLRSRASIRHEHGWRLATARRLARSLNDYARGGQADALARVALGIPDETPATELGEGRLAVVPDELSKQDRARIGTDLLHAELLVLYDEVAADASLQQFALEVPGVGVGGWFERAPGTTSTIVSGYVPASGSMALRVRDVTERTGVVGSDAASSRRLDLHPPRDASGSRRGQTYRWEQDGADQPGLYWVVDLRDGRRTIQQLSEDAYFARVMSLAPADRAPAAEPEDGS